MIFDLVCRRCGTYAQRQWDPWREVTVTDCPDCRSGMSVIGIDCGGERSTVGLHRLMAGIRGAGLQPLAIDRRGRRVRRTAA
jgi:hypothetical protein